MTGAPRAAARRRPGVAEPAVQPEGESAGQPVAPSVGGQGTSPDGPAQDVPAQDAPAQDAPTVEPLLVDAARLLALADGPPLAPEEPDSADRGPLLPLELLGWDDTDHLVGVRCSGEVVVRSGRPATRRSLAVTRLTRWARAGRMTLHCADGDVVVRLLAPSEYDGVALGDERHGRVAGPVRMARSGQLSGRRDDVARALVSRVLRVSPDVQVGNG